MSESNAPAQNPDPLYFEDYTPDFEMAGGQYRVTEEEILEFGRRFDPQPLHTDPEAAAAGPFGGLIAPGCLTFAIRNALYNQLPARPVLIAGLGLEGMELPKPVRPGDLLSLRVSVVSARRSDSKPDRGIITMKQAIENQKGELVLSMISKMIVRTLTPSDS
ncbi:MAG: dehydratase [bacterium]|nr:dehydratase [Deltaproteobacteria bacterium]MCP4906435.1 dehydratase [bacterium]